MKKILSILVLFFVAASMSHAAKVEPGVKYDLWDHPDAYYSNNAPYVNYGARFDSLGGTPAQNTFSVTENKADMKLIWSKEPGVGLMYGLLSNNDTGNTWATGYLMNAEHTDKGFVSTKGIGLLYDIADKNLYLYTGKQNSDGYSFIGQADNHRCGHRDDCKEKEHNKVGRGWMDLYQLKLHDHDDDDRYEDMTMTQMMAMMVEPNGLERMMEDDGWERRLKAILGACYDKENQKCMYLGDHTNDWLVQMKPVPVPAALPLLGSALLGFSVFSRRKKQEIQA